MDTVIKTTLVDKECDVKKWAKKVQLDLECENDSLYIMPKGYGDACSNDGHGCPIMLEVYDGELRLVVWSDINEQDPTHVITLEGARENERKVV